MSGDISFGTNVSVGWKKWYSVGCRIYPLHGPYQWVGACQGWCQGEEGGVEPEVTDQLHLCQDLILTRKQPYLGGMSGGREAGGYQGGMSGLVSRG